MPGTQTAFHLQDKERHSALGRPGQACSACHKLALASRTAQVWNEGPCHLDDSTKQDCDPPSSRGNEVPGLRDLTLQTGSGIGFSAQVWRTGEGGPRRPAGAERAIEMRTVNCYTCCDLPFTHVTSHLPATQLFLLGKIKCQFPPNGTIWSPQTYSFRFYKTGKYEWKLIFVIEFT